MGLLGAPLIRVLRVLLQEGRAAPRERYRHSLYTDDRAWRFRWFDIESRREWGREKIRRAAAGAPVPERGLDVASMTAMLKIAYRAQPADPKGMGLHDLVLGANPFWSIIPKGDA